MEFFAVLFIGLSADHLHNAFEASSKDSITSITSVTCY